MAFGTTVTNVFRQGMAGLLYERKLEIWYKINCTIAVSLNMSLAWFVYGDNRTQNMLFVTKL